MFCRQCPFTIQEVDWKNVHLHPMDLHRKTNCKFLEIYRDPRLDVVDRLPIVANHSPPIYDKYASPSTRASTFPEKIAESAKAFAEAGFFCPRRPGEREYPVKTPIRRHTTNSTNSTKTPTVGTSVAHNLEQTKTKNVSGSIVSNEMVITIVCFHCGVEIFALVGRVDADDPWGLHAHYSPNCVYLRVKKSYHFIRDALIKFVRSEIYWAILFYEIDALIQNPIYRGKIVSMLYSANLSHPKNVMYLLEAAQRRGIFPYDSVFSRVQDLPPFDHLARRGRHNRQQIDIVDMGHVPDSFYSGAAIVRPHSSGSSFNAGTKLCALCRLAFANIAYLPCGHCVSCFDCTVFKKRCISCNANIEFVSRIYFG